MRRPRPLPLLLALALVLTLLPLSAGAAESEDDTVKTDNVEELGHIPYIGGGEIDFDGERYLYAGQAALADDLRRQGNVTADDARGGLRIIDLGPQAKRDALLDGPAAGNAQGLNYDESDVVGFLDCPGTDNYVKYMDPEVFNTAEGDREFVAMAHHGNACTRDDLLGDPNTASGYGAFNGVAVVDVTDKEDPHIVDVIGHDSAHTVMPHPTRPYLYILPGGLANGASLQRISPTGIIDASDPTDLRYVQAFEHNAQGCHDLGYTADGEYAYCAGLGEVQVWDISGDNIEDPNVVGTIANPAIQFAHNVVVSPDGQYIAINDEAFGFHTCNSNAADLYGSLWIYDITVPEVPVLAGKISPPDHPNDDHITGALDDVGPIEGWAQSWCASHNYNWVPGTDIIVASWFAGGITAHDISDPLQPEMIAHYMPSDGVMWSGHYYGGFMVTNDMRRGVEILDVPELREAEREALASDGDAAEDTSLGAGLDTATAVDGPRVDMTDLLVPADLPPRPAVNRDPMGGGFCAIPGGPLD